MFSLGMMTGNELLRLRIKRHAHLLDNKSFYSILFKEFFASSKFLVLVVRFFEKNTSSKNSILYT